MRTPEQNKEMWAYLDAIRATQPELMTQRELLEALKQDKFTFSFSKHVNESDQNAWRQQVKERLIDSLEFCIKHSHEMIKKIEECVAQGKPYGHTTSDGVFRPQDVQQSLEYYRRNIHYFENEKLKKGDPASGISEINFHCFKCGVDFPLVLLSTTEIGLGPTWDMIDKRETDCTCPFHMGMKPVTVKFDVPTGVLVFSNFFDDRKKTNKKEDECDCYSICSRDKDGKTEMEIFEPKDRWAREWSLNEFIGRVNRMKHYSSKFNIAYGQMGNMSISIYINRNKDQILIACPDVSDESKSRAYKQFLRFRKMGFKEIGSISLEMWRWMAADKSILDKYEIPLKEEGDSFGICTVKVKKGQWKMTHYYDSDKHKDGDFVYSVLKLVDNPKRKK